MIASLSQFESYGNSRYTHGAMINARAVLRLLLLTVIVGLVPFPVLSADIETSRQVDITTLDSLLRQIRARNPDIAAAKFELEAARQRIAPARAFDDPMLEVGVVNVPVESMSFRREDMTMKMLGVSQRLPFPGKRALRAAVASLDAESMAFAYQETINRTVRDACVAYSQLILIRQSRNIVQSNRVVVEQFLRVAEGRYTVGQSGQPDVLKAQTQLTRMADELLRIDGEEAAMQADLNRLRDTASAEPLAPVASAVARSEPDSALMRQLATDRRPQLHGLKSMIERYDREAALMRREFYPDFDVRVGYGQRERTLDGMPRDDMVSLTVAVNLPIWRKSRLEPRVAEAHAMSARASEMYRAQTAEVFAALDTQIAVIRQSRLSLNLITTGLLPQSRLTVESSLAAYRVGRVDFATLLDNQMIVYTYELEWARATQQLAKAFAEIDFLIGGPVG